MSGIHHLLQTWHSLIPSSAVCTSLGAYRAGRGLHLASDYGAGGGLHLTGALASCNGCIQCVRWAVTPGEAQVSQLETHCVPAAAPHIVCLSPFFFSSLALAHAREEWKE